MADFNLENIAALARIRISDSDKKSLEKDFKEILAFVERVQEVATNDDPSGRVGDVHNVMREDGAAEGEPRQGREPHEKGEYTEKLLEQAPKTEKGFVKVKKIL